MLDRWPHIVVSFREWHFADSPTVSAAMAVADCWSDRSVAFLCSIIALVIWESAYENAYILLARVLLVE